MGYFIYGIFHIIQPVCGNKKIIHECFWFPKMLKAEKLPLHPENKQKAN